MDRLTIDEVIDHCNRTCERMEMFAVARKNTKSLNNDKTYLEHRQVAEWLEQLKKIRWIPISERLPKETKKVLTCDKYGNIHTFDFFMGRNKIPFGIGDDHPKFYPIVAWMPLPDPYKEEVE